MKQTKNDLLTEMNFYKTQHSELKDKISYMRKALNDIYNVVVDNGDGTSEEVREIAEDVMNNHW
tara:strand:- start:551 stop:742 length:192 start_codon:yes stop_codon:yes gene_type:complete